jgi:hypothetical protein
MANEGLFLVFSNAKEGQEDEYNRWYDERHIVDVCAIPGITSGQRYTLNPHDDPMAKEPPAHRHLAAYTIEVEPDAIMKEFMSRMTTGELDVSPALDMKTVKMAFWAPNGPRREG